MRADQLSRVTSVSLGTRTALTAPVAIVRRYQDLIAWQLADRFHQEVVGLIRGSTSAGLACRYRNQLMDAAGDIGKDIAEGFLRRSPRVFANFLDYALGSLVEAEGRLRDGITRGYFTPSDCAEAFQLAKRCLSAMIRLKQSQFRYAEQHFPKRTSRR